MAGPITNIPDADDYLRRQAYYWWEADGRPTGRDLEHWERARRPLRGANDDGIAGSAATLTYYEGGISAQPPIVEA